MKRRARWLPLLASAGVVVLAFALVHTETGLRWSFRLAQTKLPGELDADRLSGRLTGPLEIGGLRYRDGGVDVRIGRASLDWRPHALLTGRISIRELLVDDVDVAIAGTQGAKEPDRRDFSLAMPLPVLIERLEIRNTTLHMPKGDPLTLDRLGLRATARGDGVAIDELRVEAMGFTVDAEGRLPLSSTGPLRLGARFDGDGGGLTWRGTATFAGTPAAIDVRLTLAEPIGALGEATLEALAGPPRWRASAGVDPFTLDALVPDGRPLRIRAGEFEAAGAGAAFDARGHLAVGDDEFGAWGIDFDGRVDDSRRELRSFTIAALDGDARVEGRAAQTPGRGANDDRFDVTVRWENLAWPPTGDPRAASPHGNATLSGRLDDYRFSVTGLGRYAEVPPFDLALHGRGNRDGVDVGELRGGFLDGDWRGAGRFAWRPAPRWELTLAADGVDPALLHAEAAGRLDGRLRLDGSYDEALALAIDVDGIGGVLRGHPFEGRARVTIDGATTDVTDLLVRAGGIALDGNAHFGEQWNIGWRIDATDLDVLLPGLGGEARSQGTVSGPPDALRAGVLLDAAGLTWDEHAIGRLGLSADVALGGDGRWRAALAADDVRAAGRALGRVTLDTEGTTLDHTALLGVEHPRHRFEQRLAGALRDKVWHARLHRGHLEEARIGAWSQQADTALALTPDTLALDDYCWEQDAAAVCLRGGRDGEALGARLDWRALDLSRLDPWMPDDRIGLSGVTHGVVEFHHRDGGDPLRVSVRGEPGALRYPLPPRGEMHALEFESISLTATADDERGLLGEFRLVLKDGEHVDAGIALPQWRPSTGAPGPDEAVRGRFDIELRDFSVLTLVLPEWQAGPGGITAGIDVDGTVGAPLIDGELKAAIEYLAFARFGVRLDDLTVDTRIRRNDWTLAGAARMDQGRLDLTGNGTVRSAGDWRGEIALNGEDLRIMRMPTADVSATPALTLRVDPRELVFDGSLTIPRARLEPVAPESLVPASDDIVIVGAPGPEETPSPFDVHGQIELVLGDQVRLIGMGFEGRLTGRLRLMLERDGSVNGQGEIRVADGRYRAYGQNLSITQGRVLYAGGPLDNPAIDIIASRMRGEIEVGVRVTGTAERPQIALFSNPAMDDADVLSYLILGRPMDQAGQSDGQLLHRAATSAALVGGEALADRISDRFDIAEVSIEAGDDTADAALVVGRAISRRLYVRYIQGLVENTSAFQLRYQLSDKWTIETESGTRSGAGADILYTLER